MSKYDPITLPETPEEAAKLAELQETWAADAMKNDMMGSWKQFSLTAVLLRDLEKRLKS